MICTLTNLVYSIHINNIVREFYQSLNLLFIKEKLITKKICSGIVHWLIRGQRCCVPLLSPLYWSMHPSWRSIFSISQWKVAPLPRGSTASVHLRGHGASNHTLKSYQMIGRLATKATNLSRERTRSVRSAALWHTWKCGRKTLWMLRDARRAPSVAARQESFVWKQSQIVQFLRSIWSRRALYSSI